MLHYATLNLKSLTKFFKRFFVHFKLPIDIVHFKLPIDIVHFKLPIDIVYFKLTIDIVHFKWQPEVAVNYSCLFIICS